MINNEFEQFMEAASEDVVRLAENRPCHKYYRGVCR